MSFTLVTALYEISRDKYDGRKFTSYQTWFENTLKIPAPMVIFTEEKNRHIVEKIRKDMPTKCFYTKLQEVPFYHTTSVVEHIITNTSFKDKIKHPNGLENRCFEYIPIIHSKFIWMKQACNENYFKTKMIFWIDAGISRFMNFDISKQQFNNELLIELHTKNKILMQIGKKHNLIDIINNNNVESYIGSNTNFMMAGFWGGNIEIINDISSEGASLYEKEFLEKNRVDNEQTLFGYIIPKYKDNILFIDNIPSKEYLVYYIFTNQMNV